MWGLRRGRVIVSFMFKYSYRHVIITQALPDYLTSQSKASPRLRMNMDLRNSSADQSQRMLNAIARLAPGLLNEYG